MRYRSKRVGKYRSELEVTVKSRFPRRKGLHVSFESTKIPYVTKHEYIPDFQITLKSGKTFFVEVKGHFRPEDKRKMAAVKQQHPALDIRMVFGSSGNGPKGLQKNRRNLRWCERYGIPAAIDTAPAEWFDE